MKFCPRCAGECPECARLQPENARLRAKCDELRGLLAEAIECIKVFHGPMAWDIYYNQSPEMKRFRAALSQQKAVQRGETDFCTHGIDIQKPCEKCRQRSVRAGKPEDNTDRYFPPPKDTALNPETRIGSHDDRD